MAHLSEFGEKFILSVTTAVHARIQLVGTKRSSSNIALITDDFPAPVFPTTPMTVFVFTACFLRVSETALDFAFEVDHERIDKAYQFVGATVRNPGRSSFSQLMVL